MLKILNLLKNLATIINIDQKRKQKLLEEKNKLEDMYLNGNEHEKFEAWQKLGAVSGSQ